MHRCHAIGCTAAVVPGYPMCEAHWCSVPGPLRAAVLRHGDVAPPTPEYTLAVREAVLALAVADGRVTQAGAAVELAALRARLRRE